jgi:hypothetical protein
MPLVKRQNGWYWGSKGPFKSKAKALSVARAAYASGYKEDQESAAGSSGEPVDQDANVHRKEKNLSISARTC